MSYQLRELFFPKNFSGEETAKEEMMKERGTEKKSTKTEKDPETKLKRTKVKNFFSRVGYSVWLIVMIVGGVLAFLVSLFLL